MKKHLLIALILCAGCETIKKENRVTELSKQMEETWDLKTCSELCGKNDSAEFYWNKWDSLYKLKYPNDNDCYKPKNCNCK